MRRLFVIVGVSLALLAYVISAANDFAKQIQHQRTYQAANK